MAFHALINAAIILSHLVAVRNAAICPEILEQVAPHALGIHFEHESIESRNQAPTVWKSRAASQPRLEWIAERDTYYTVLMADPDAPSHANPNMAQWLHWLVVNVPAGDEDIEQGDTLMSYAGPTPPRGTGNHRYCLYVFKQDGGRSDELANFQYPERKKFNAQDFVMAASDQGVPLQLVAANYFYSNHGETEF